MGSCTANMPVITLFFARLSLPRRTSTVAV
jgi:hypothetical protein